MCAHFVLPVTRCNTLQHIQRMATHYKTLVCTVCTNFLLHTTHCNALQRTTTHCNALQRTTTHYNARTATHYNAPQRTATHCNILNALQYTATHSCILCVHTFFSVQRTTTHGNPPNALQHTVTHSCIHSAHAFFHGLTCELTSCKCMRHTTHLKYYTSEIDMRHTTHSYLTHELFIYTTRLNHLCSMTHSYVRCGWFIHVVSCLAENTRMRAREHVRHMTHA